MNRWDKREWLTKVLGIVVAWKIVGCMWESILKLIKEQ